MYEFEQQVQKVIQGYSGPFQEIIQNAPYFYRLLTRVLDDPELPGRLRPLVLVTVAYFQLPIDVTSEDIAGPRGYLDDIFLTAFILNQVRQESGSSDLLERNWEGIGDLLPLIDRILRSERELIGDQREVILWYIGYEHLLSHREA